MSSDMLVLRLLTSCLFCDAAEVTGDEVCSMEQSDITSVS